jgi:KaiC/GvpD/RAD55 family RecA-like ATPase
VDTPYSYARGGVGNKKLRSPDTDDFYDFAKAYAKPRALDTSYDEYHAMDKPSKNETKRKLDYFVGGTLEPAIRRDSNVVCRTLLTLDIEENVKKGSGPPPDPDEVVLALAELGRAGWVYTSVGHTPESPRYRVVLPLDEPIYEDIEDTLRDATLGAARELGIKAWCARESYVPSQPMYLPAVLDGGTHYNKFKRGAPWEHTDYHKESASTGDDWDGTAPKPVHATDPVLAAVMQAGLYIGPKDDHPGMHFIRCPFADEHGEVNDTQTVYYEANYDGNPRAAVKCFDTAPDEDDKPHLTYTRLVQWLREHEYLSAETDGTGVLDDYDDFLARADITRLLNDTPEERHFAVDRLLPRGKVTVIAGPGGVSKSSMLMHMMVYGAMGQSFYDFKPDGELKSLYVSYEDDTLELHKRVHALSHALREFDDGKLDLIHDVDAKLKRNFLTFAADDNAASWLLMSKPDQRSQAERTARVEWLVGLLKREGIRLLTLDPVVYTHNMEESSPGEMAQYMQTLTYIAKQADCAVCVLHHMHKAALWQTIDEINQGSLRGASSFADNARSVAVVLSMGNKDAPLFGLESSQETTDRYVIFKHVKHNYSAGLGVMVMERRGSLLIPRPDIKKLDGAELAASKERMAEAKKEMKEASKLNTMERHGMDVIKWLRKQEHECSQNMVCIGTGKAKPAVKKIMEWLHQEGLVDMELGPNRGMYYAPSQEGLDWHDEKELM